MLGFTRRESSLLLFLLVTFLLGLFIRLFQIKWAPLPETPSLSQVLKNNGDDEKKIIQKEDSKKDSFYIILNTAVIDDFKQLPGIGPVKAERIFKFREENGCFNSIEELKKVKGIGNKTIERIKPFIRLN